MPQYTVEEPREREAFESIEKPFHCAATLVGVREKKMPFKSKIDGTDVFMVEFKFCATDGKYSGRNFWAETWRDFNANSVLMTWISKIRGHPVQPGEVIDTDDYLGNSGFEVYVEAEEYESKERDADGNPIWKWKNPVADIITLEPQLSVVPVGAGVESEPF